MRAFPAAVGYYVAGRFAFLNLHASHVAANLLHHGVEMLLKTILSKDDSEKQIRGYYKQYRHSLGRIWEEIKRRNPGIDLTRHDRTIEALDPFEDIRYPEQAYAQGLPGINLSVQPNDLPAAGDPGHSRFSLSVNDVDRLVADLYQFTGPPNFILMGDAAARHYNEQNPCPLDDLMTVERIFANAAKES